MEGRWRRVMEREDSYGRVIERKGRRVMETKEEESDEGEGEERHGGGG